MAVNAGLSLDCANAILNAFRNQPHALSTVYILLHTNVPGEDCDNNISAGDDSLKLVLFNNPTAGALTLSASPVWTNDSATETLRYISAWDGPDGPGADTPQWAIQLTTPQAWVDADTYTLDSLGIALAPILVDDGS